MTRRLMRGAWVSAFAWGARSRAIRAPVLALALAATTACGGDGGETAARETGTEAAGDAGAAVVEVEDRPRATTSLDDVQEAAIELPGGPDWLTSHAGFVWVKRDDGVVTRIDPASNRPNGEVRADTKSEQFCQGIGSGGGAVWSCSGSDVVRIDPKRLRVTASVPAGKVFDQGRLVFVGGHVWLLSGEGDRLVGIDAATARVGPTVDLPVPCSELGPGADVVWVLCPRGDAVLGVDPMSGSVTVELELDDPSVAVATDRDLWVGSAGSLVRVDLETRRPVARFAELDLGDEGDLAVDGDTVWARTGAGFLHRIDASTNTLAEQIEPPSRLSGGSLLVVSGSVWTTAYDDNLLLRLRAGR